jgi:hypothetical protein
MDRRQEPAPGQKPERVADVDHSASRVRLHAEPALVPWQQDLQPTLLGEQEDQGADVGVLVVALCCRVGVLGVAEQSESAARSFLWFLAFHQEAVGILLVRLG